jgi:hypothetical protein
MYSKVDNSQIGSSAFTVECPRYSNGSVTAATRGLAYYDLTNTAHLYLAFEVLGSTACAT